MPPGPDESLTEGRWCGLRRCHRWCGKYGVAVAVAAAGAPGVSLIRTKVHGPVPRALVPRPALVERLVHGPARKLTLIRGQAGWGKSSVLAGWSAADPRAFAWLALDRGDNDPVRFFMYVIEALHTVADSVGERSASVLRTRVWTSLTRCCRS